MPAVSAALEIASQSSFVGRIDGAVGWAMQVVKLGDRGVTRLQHLDEQLCRDDLEVRGRDPVGERVHRLPPGPEAVARGQPVLRIPRHGALEGVAVSIRHAGNHEPRDVLGAGRRVIRRALMRGRRRFRCGRWFRGHRPRRPRRDASRSRAGPRPVDSAVPCRPTPLWQVGLPYDHGQGNHVRCGRISAADSVLEMGSSVDRDEHCDYGRGPHPLWQARARGARGERRAHRLDRRGRGGAAPGASGRHPDRGGGGPVDDAGPHRLPYPPGIRRQSRRGVRAAALRCAL